MILKIRETLGGIFAVLGDIAVNETGFVRQRSSFAAAWVVGMLVVGAVLFGMPDRAVAACSPGSHPMDPCIQSVCRENVCQGYYDCEEGSCYLNPGYCVCWDPKK